MPLPPMPGWACSAGHSSSSSSSPSASPASAIMPGDCPTTCCSDVVAARSSEGVFARSIPINASSPFCALSLRGLPPSVSGKSMSCASWLSGLARSRLLILVASRLVGAPGGGVSPSPALELAPPTVRPPSIGPEPGSGGMPSGKAVGSLPSMRMCCIFWPRRSAEFQWFLDALSVRPGRYLAMSAHLLPNLLCSSSSIRSSSSVHASLRMSWSRWLCQRSRHCLPVRPGKCWATSVQLRVPCTPTRCLTSASSCAVHCLRVVPSFSLSLSGLASSRPSALSDAAGSQANMEPSSASSILVKM
mmetsp:Transcript_78839/g.190597  ORF Transcript_78839/g.190597 Transcript_78839/m.190597 type:complete len:303 (-) Transcript_78839:51-959(-)